MPVSAISSVRGIGLAVKVSTSTPSAMRFTASLCVTPKRCSSSTTSTPRRLNCTSWASSRCVPMTTSTVPSARPCTTCALLGRREEAAEQLDPDRVGRIALGEGLRVLARQQRRRDQDRRLGAVLHGFEDRPHGDLGLAEPDVPADQPVHGPRLLHVGLDVRDGLELVLRLDEAERRLHLGLPGGVGAEGVALDGQAAPVELDQFGRHLAGGRPRLGPRALPVGAAHLRQRRRLAPRVRGDGLDLLDREVEAIRTAVLQDQVVPGRAAHGPGRHALEAGHAVLAVHDEAPRLEVVEEAVRRARPRPGPPVRHAAAGDVGLGEHAPPLRPGGRTRS